MSGLKDESECEKQKKAKIANFLKFVINNTKKCTVNKELRAIELYCM